MLYAFGCRQTHVESRHSNDHVPVLAAPPKLTQTNKHTVSFSEIPAILKGYTSKLRSNYKLGATQVRAKDMMAQVFVVSNILCFNTVPCRPMPLLVHF